MIIVVESSQRVLGYKKLRNYLHPQIETNAVPTQ
jgi:hypothetical protein